MFLLLSICSFLSFANEYRTDPTLPAEVEKIRQEQILLEAIDSLPNYDAQNSLEEALTQFLKDNGFVNPILIDAAETQFKGKTSDRVFFVEDQEVVIKAFKNCNRFLPEISGLNLISELKWTYVVPIQPLAVGKYRDWAFLLETKAKGKRLDEFLTSPHLEKALTRMAISLVELHQIKSKTFLFPSAIINKYEEKLAKILDTLSEELSKHLDLARFADYVRSVKDQAAPLSISYSYWHGDAHLGNMFYNDEEDRFYFIDVAKMHASIDLHGEPLQDGAYDLFRAEENFRRLTLGILSEEEFPYFLEVIEQTYLEKQPLDPRLITFYKTYTKMGRLIEYSKYKDKVFEEAVSYFKEFAS